MSKKPVVKRWDKAGKTEIWHRNSAGSTTKEGHRTHYHDSGNVVDHYGKKVGNSKGRR